MSVLFQDFCKYYNLSVQDNIGLGGPGETHSISASRTAATLTGAHEHIRGLRAFYETILKKSYHSSRTIDSSSYDYYHGPESLPKRRDPTEEEKFPFLVKTLCSEPHAQASARGKRISWLPKPDPRENLYDCEIPDYNPELDVLPERIHSQSLSGGQWQRIALARSFMKIREADLFILDEPSSALDPQAEYEVFKSIMELRKNRTTIFIVFKSLLSLLK